MSTGAGHPSLEPLSPDDIPETPQISTSISENRTAGEPLEKTISCVSCRKRKLRCDRVKPKCGTCTRLRHECEFPERRRNLGSKRRNMKELEARLAQVETKLVSEVEAHNSRKSKKTSPKTNFEEILETDLDINNVEMDSGFSNEQVDFGFIPTPPSIPVGDPMSQELISLGLDEPLPPRHMIDELEELYFKNFQVSIPMIHKYRYYASLDLAPHMRPPICLRYAMWVTAACDSGAYVCYEDILYKRARKYAEAAEMKGFGESFVTVYHAQTWGLIAQFEAKRTYFSRSWMSSGRMVRLSHMLGLHRLDGDMTDVKHIISPPKDWIEKEERRRTFWLAFYGDRWASSGTGWPMGINESEILTNLPASEESFEHGVEEKTISLAEALTPGGAPHISSFAGVILSASLFGHNFQHLHRTSPDERPDDYAGGEFWKRHRKMDNVLSNTFMFLPDHLRIPNALKDMNVIFMHMNIHASIICLHQAAILTAERYKISANVIQQCRDRSLMAAQEIASIMRLCSHVNASKLNAWIGFFLFVAAGVCLQNATGENPSPESLHNLEFILGAMNAIGQKHSVTKHFTAQLELDIEASKFDKCKKQKLYYSCAEVRLAPELRMTERTVLPTFKRSDGIPTAARDIQSLARAGIQIGKEWPEHTSIGGTPRNTLFDGRPNKIDSSWDFGRQPDGSPNIKSLSAHASSTPIMDFPENLPIMTPIVSQTSTPEVENSRSFTNSTPLPPNGLSPTLDQGPRHPLRFPFRAVEPYYQSIPVTQGSWPQLQPQIEQPEVDQPEVEPTEAEQPQVEQPAFVPTDPTWYDPTSLNSPRNPELDALLDGIVWDSHPARY